ncbi:MAG: hypothetical protein EGS70_05735 [Clostridiales bacterium]|nr:hypothetical protein [Clostridiales bacterium]
MFRAVEGKRALHAHLRGRKRRDDPLVVLRGEFVLRHAGQFGWQALAARHFVPAGGKGDALEQLALGAQAGGGVGGGQCAVLGVGRGGAAGLQAKAEQQGERRQHQHPAQQGSTVNGCANDGILAFFVHVHRSFLP